MIERNLFENWVPVMKARKLVDEFFDDRTTYTDYEFYSRKRGIYKDIPEELYPLLLFAESLSSVASIRLSPDSLPGPDGTAFLNDGSEITVQVTLSKERGEGYKKRLSLRDTKGPQVSVRNTNEVVEERLERIIAAIREKETNFHDGTEILLVVDEAISWGDIIDPGLPNAIQEAAVSLPPSKYSATYIIFGKDVRQIR
jgi:hypothetical protein